jgi:hypothetical protein
VSAAKRDILTSTAVEVAAVGPMKWSDPFSTEKETLTEERLYQLIRQSGTVADHTFEIRFLDRGVPTRKRGIEDLPNQGEGKTTAEPS